MTGFISCELALSAEFGHPVLERCQPANAMPYADCFNSLDAQAAAKVAVTKLRMEMGNTSSVKWFDGIGEYRIDWGPGYRIYLAKDGNTYIVLFGGGTKKSQTKDIATAKTLHTEYKARKKALALAPRPGTRKMR
jgi:putative addiction module killer protein